MNLKDSQKYQGVSMVLEDIDFGILQELADNPQTTDIVVTEILKCLAVMFCTEGKCCTRSKNLRATK